MSDCRECDLKTHRIVSMQKRIDDLIRDLEFWMKAHFHSSNALERIQAIALENMHHPCSLEDHRAVTETQEEGIAADIAAMKTQVIG